MNIETKTGTETLALAWQLRSQLIAKGSKLWAEGHKLWAEGSKLYAESDELRAEGSKLCAESDELRAEGSKLYAEGNKLWAEAIIKARGNIGLTWEAASGGARCTLETGERFDP